jgi:predicted nucleic acid-binding protein
MTLVDTNVLLDILTDDPAWLDWSAEQLDRQAVQKPLIINEVRFHNVLFYVSSFHLEHRATESFD